MTKIRISSHKCGLTHTIFGRVEQNRIIIEIDTPCEKFSKLNPIEFHLHELPDNQDMLTLEMAGQTECSLECTRECALDCTRSCLIPSAVFNVCCMERELAETPVLESMECTVSELE
ncbi:hypothetical protein FTO70_13190 [Methanosarcina sp. KYL-1]|uniref:DUF6951 family protein n=1 Tax=Methanosarcina sp. KYL-1 TaxID=2602068 RepID=UPI002101AD90|nr:hypothetical protein [Methanosarcina sp. KYL-1]MCQ1536607.1 hypothetical protein [Methanosarcina sp. KYL-1]